MKTAISIPDDLFADAEQMAETLGMSRSELFRTALEEYMERHRADRITERLNEIYSQEDSSIDPVIERLQFETLDSEDW